MDARQSINLLDVHDAIVDWLVWIDAGNRGGHGDMPEAKPLDP
jgi:hypothetical protein